MLDKLKPNRGATRPPKRVGRGPGSGTGKTAARGVKGQGKRSPGRETPFHFEGGQMPITRRLPKRGFHNIHRVSCDVINLGRLAALGDGATVDRETLEAKGLIRRSKSPVKVLAEGDCPKNLTLKVQRISAAARQKVEAAGGTVELIK
jgi:large subunit ribosomal protein L15